MFRFRTQTVQPKPAATRLAAPQEKIGGPGAGLGGHEALVQQTAMFSIRMIRIIMIIIMRLDMILIMIIIMIMIMRITIIIE